MKITWPAVEQVATAFLILLRCMFATLANMNQSRCVVTFTDSDRSVHEVEVWASTVYEAVGESMREFRAGGITRDLPGLNSELSIAAHRQPVTHKLQLRQVTQ